jgi:hypothetical protein
MLQITKIEDKTLNLDVQGQGCWNDCFIGEHWELKTANVSECVFYTDKHTAKTFIFW